MRGNGASWVGGGGGAWVGAKDDDDEDDDDDDSHDGDSVGLLCYAPA